MAKYYHGPKPRAYSKLSKKDKAKEDAYNESHPMMKHTKKSNKRSTKARKRTGRK